MFPSLSVIDLSMLKGLEIMIWLELNIPMPPYAWIAASLTLNQSQNSSAKVHDRFGELWETSSTREVSCFLKIRAFKSIQSIMKLEMSRTSPFKRLR